ncbi:MAG: hypothetical protein GX066_02050 [Clostridiaceae bacterium]|nr:hypothetical protein [Clostridiaceae bacterium]
MKTLVGEIIQEGTITKTAKLMYNDRKGFFIAYVSICDELGIGVPPIWTSVEDKILEKNGMVQFEIEEGIILRIYHQA